jgi:hypothetical protein
MSDKDQENIEREGRSEDPDVEAHKKKVAEEPQNEEDADFEAHKKK